MNISMSFYNKLIRQQFVCHNTNFVVTPPVTTCRTVDVNALNTVQVIGEYITENIQQLHILGIAQE